MEKCCVVLETADNRTEPSLFMLDNEGCKPTRRSMLYFITLPLRQWLREGASVLHCIARAERDGTRAETRIRLSPKRTSPFKSVGASVQSTAGSRGVRIGFSNDGYTTLGGGLRVLATHSIRQFPPHFPSRASPCATRFRTNSTYIACLVPRANSSFISSRFNVKIMC